MKRANIFALAVMGMVFITALGSCTSEEEKTYGKILSKDKTEVELIKRVQEARFEINENVTLKEAVALNEYSKNIEWDIIPLEDHGTYLVSFQYDIDPIERAMNMSFFNGDDQLIANIFFAFDPLGRGSAVSQDLRTYQHGDILSPVGYANIFTRFIFGEMLYPNGNTTSAEMKALLEACEEYQRNMREFPFLFLWNGFPRRSLNPSLCPLPESSSVTATWKHLLMKLSLQHSNYSLTLDFLTWTTKNIRESV